MATTSFLGGGGGAGEAGERLEGDGVHGVHAAAVDLDAGVQRHAGALEVGQLTGVPGRLRVHKLPEAAILTTADISRHLRSYVLAGVAAVLALHSSISNADAAVKAWWAVLDTGTWLIRSSAVAWPEARPQVHTYGKVPAPVRGR